MMNESSRIIKKGFILLEQYLSTPYTSGKCPSRKILESAVKPDKVKLLYQTTSSRITSTINDDWHVTIMNPFHNEVSRLNNRLASSYINSRECLFFPWKTQISLFLVTCRNNFWLPLSSRNLKRIPVPLYQPSKSCTYCPSQLQPMYHLCFS